MTTSLPASPTRARIIAVLALLTLGMWLIHGFIPALAWATVIAIATWPLRCRLQAAWPHASSTRTALVLTLIVGAALFIPLGYAVLQASHEAHIVAEWLTTVQKQGVHAPPWLAQLPFGSAAALEWWNGHLADPSAATDLLRRINAGDAATFTRTLGTAVLHRLVILSVALLTLFFLYRDGQALAGATMTLSRRLWGDPGERYVFQTSAALRATVNGLVLVGVAEAVLFTFAYVGAGVAHAVVIGALTGVLSMIPLAAPVLYGIAALILYAQGNSVAALGLLIFCSAVVFVADHFVRPVLIGSATRLPFLWVLLGIFGGLETLGLIGLFLGPAVMAVLIALWRDATAEVPPY